MYRVRRAAALLNGGAFGAHPGLFTCVGDTVVWVRRAGPDSQHRDL